MLRGADWYGLFKTARYEDNYETAGCPSSRAFETWDSTVYVAFPCQPCYPVFMQVTVEIPDRFVPHLVPAGRDAARSLLEESVAGAYRDGRLTMEQVRQLLGFGTRMLVHAFLQQHQIYDYTVDDLNQDMATLDRLLATKAG